MCSFPKLTLGVAGHSAARCKPEDNIMEAVKAFNNELYSLNEYKPPISKAKMTQITKSGIKAIKVSM
ncbi:hypothetical protein INR49_003000 [Caranx melampygus]|nr:hypothetical protein INR49_003000 [Caranx melampygus]